ncbi:hypothetical protein M1D51_12600 [Arthrobacter sp. R3-55]
MLPGIATEPTGKQLRHDLGWLMSIPNRHQLVWHVIIDDGVLGALDGTVSFTAMGYSDAPGPVSPHVYWWNGTGYEQLTQLSEEDGSLSIHVSPEFHVLETATPATELGKSTPVGEPQVSITRTCPGLIFL